MKWLKRNPEPRAPRRNRAEILELVLRARKARDPALYSGVDPQRSAIKLLLQGAHVSSCFEEDIQYIANLVTNFEVFLRNEDIQLGLGG